MSVKVRIPTPLRSVTKGVSDVTAEGATVREVIEDLERQFPGMRERLCEDSGEIRRFVNVFVGEEDVRFLDGIDTKLGDGQSLSIVPAVAGGGGGPLTAVAVAR